MKRLFGTDGIRGLPGQKPLDDETLEKIGRALTVFFRKRFPDIKKVIIGRDTRISGEHILGKLSSGINTGGLDVSDLGIFTTPGISFITRKNSDMAGVVISASHNPYQYNGIKVFSPSGQKLSIEEEDEIESILRGMDPCPPRMKRGRIKKNGRYRIEYIDSIRNNFLPGASLAGMVIAADCANGATSDFTAEVFESSGADIHILNHAPDGKNINLGCGSMHPEYIGSQVKECRADIGMSFDGDGDRVIFVDEKGEVLDGDKTIVILAKYLKQKGCLKNNAVVVTVMSNWGLYMALKEEGIDVIQVPVGDRNVLEGMLKNDIILGGEQSGHIILLEHGLTGDGLVTAAQILNILSSSKTPLSVLSRCMDPLPQILINIPVKEKIEWEKLPEIEEKLRNIQQHLGRAGRILLRYSGTEPLARVMVEGRDRKEIIRIAEDMSDSIRKKLGD